MALNEWKPLKRQAGLNSGVQDARVSSQLLPRPPTRVPLPLRVSASPLPVEGAPCGEELGRSRLPGRGGVSPCPRLRAGPDGKETRVQGSPPGDRRRAGTAEPSLPFTILVYPRDLPERSPAGKGVVLKRVLAGGSQSELP